MRACTVLATIADVLDTEYDGRQCSSVWVVYKLLLGWRPASLLYIRIITISWQGIKKHIGLLKAAAAA